MIRLNKRLLRLGAAALCLLAAASLGAQELEKFEARLLYSDGSELYRSPVEPAFGEAVTVKLRVKANSLDTVNLHTVDEVIPMLKGAEDGPFEWYFAEIPPADGITEYWFEAAQGNKRVFYSRRGIELKAPSSSYRFKIIPGFDVPDWMFGSVLYQIFVDRFYNGDPTNDVVDNEYLYDNWPAVKVDDWYQLPDAWRTYADGSDRTREFYGGDIQGVIDKLDYLAELGIEGIYFNPLFVSPSNHKYDTQDYLHVDPHLGVIVNDGGDVIDPEADPNYGSSDFSNASEVNAGATKYILRTTDPENLAASDALVKTLIDEAHARGMKVILDGVFNHSGSFNRWLDREQIYADDPNGPGAYWSPDSPYSDYFVFADPDGWPGNESYEAWWGYKTLPKLNLDGSPELEQKILDVAAYWIEQGADGWRIDVAADIGHDASYNHEFFRKFRDAVKSVNPEAVILAEVYGDSSAWLRGDEWDTVMNYDAFFEPVSWYLTGLEKHSYVYREDLHHDGRAFQSALAEKMAKLPWVSLVSSMNQLDNHDHSRFLSRTSFYVDGDRASKDISDQSMADVGINKGIFKEATVLMMVLPGAPTLYYGDEAGLTGLTDPDNRRTYPWGREDQELLAFHNAVIDLHRSYPALLDGSYVSVGADTAGMFAAARWDQDDVIVAAVNNSDHERRVKLDLTLVGYTGREQLETLLTTSQETHGIGGPTLRADDGELSVTIPAWGSVVLRGPGVPEPFSADSLRPQVAAVSPVGNAERGDPIQITFSAPMYQRDILDAFRVSPAVPGTFAWNHTTVTFRPAQSFAAGTEVTVTLTRDIRSVDGNFFLAEGEEWSFTVR
jgi:alpha-glucosidase